MCLTCQCAGHTASVPHAIASRISLYYCCSRCGVVKDEMRSFMQDLIQQHSDFVNEFSNCKESANVDVPGPEIAGQPDPHSAGHFSCHL